MSITFPSAGYSVIARTYCDVISVSGISLTLTPDVVAAAAYKHLQMKIRSSLTTEEISEMET